MDRLKVALLTVLEGSVTTITPRQREVVALLVTGLSYGAIARELGISPRTVENHVATIADKLPNGASALRRVLRDAVSLLAA